MAEIVAVALDVGSTSIKLAACRDNGAVEVLFQEQTPALDHDGLKVTGDAKELIRVCLKLLGQAKEITPRQTSLSITCQRSSFVVWSKINGELLSPMISWQDRYYGSSDLNEEEKNLLQRCSGLVPSPYYLGPKLNGWLSENKHLVHKEIMVGTLDTYLVWCLSRADCFVMDKSMAARTALFDLSNGQWSKELLDLFSVPEQILPELVSTCHLNLELDQHWVLASMSADQSASLFGHDPQEGDICVNFGTGVFVLKVQGATAVNINQYQNALFYESNKCSFFNEGAINGLTRSLKENKVSLDSSMRCDSDVFCRVDGTGLGAPYWKPKCGFMTSMSDFKSAPHELRRSVLIEGVCFRVAEMIEQLSEKHSRVIVSGGASNDRVLIETLSQIISNKVFRVNVSESSLRGALKFAQAPCSELKFIEMDHKNHAGLIDKYHRWKYWMQKNLNATTP